MVNTVWVNANHGRDLHPLANYTTKLRNFTNEESRDFSAFRFFTSVNASTINSLSDNFTKTTY